MPPSGKFYLASGAGGPKEPLYSLLYVDKKADGRERELSLELSNDDSIMHIDNKVPLHECELDLFGVIVLNKIAQS